MVILFAEWRKLFGGAKGEMKANNILTNKFKRLNDNFISDLLIFF
jgi:hypothetical protein